MAVTSVTPIIKAYLAERGVNLEDGTTAVLLSQHGDDGKGKLCLTVHYIDDMTNGIVYPRHHFVLNAEDEFAMLESIREQLEGDNNAG
jgi:hypothetical protein